MKQETKLSILEQLWAGFAGVCDDLEQSGAWNTGEYGQMEAYYANELYCVLIRAMVSDGEICVEEADSLLTFVTGPDSVTDVKSIYEENREYIDALTERSSIEALELLRSVSTKAFKLFLDMSVFFLSTVISADDKVQLGEIEQLTDYLEKLRDVENE